MANYNNIVLVGNLSKDPEIRYANNGTAICSFAIATNHRFKRGDETVDEPMFIDVTAFGRLAEICGEYLKKGAPTLVDGRLRLEQWESQEGQRRSKHSVVANTVQFLGRKEESAGYNPGRRVADDDIPF